MWFLFIVIAVVAVVVYLAMSETKKEKELISRSESGDIQAVFELMRFYINKRKNDKAKERIEKSIALFHTDSDKMAEFGQGLLEIEELFINKKAFNDAKYLIEEMRKHKLINETVLDELSNKLDEEILANGPVHDRIKMLIEKGGTPEQLRIDEVDTNVDLKDSSQYVFVKELLFYLVERGAEIRYVSTIKGQRHYYGLVSIGYTRTDSAAVTIRFAKHANELYVSLSQLDFNPAEYKGIHDGDGIIIEAESYLSSYCEDCLKICADFYINHPAVFNDSERYLRHKSSFPSSPLVQLHEYIKSHKQHRM